MREEFNLAGIAVDMYLDTSVINFYFAEDSPEKMSITQKFFREISIGGYKVFISEVVIREINDASEPKRTKLLDIIDRHTPKMLRLDTKCENLADKFVKEGIIPVRHRDDALHIAIAVLNDIDVIVSWNMRHMVKLKTIEGVNSITKKLNLKRIDIRTPEEVLP